MALEKPFSPLHKNSVWVKFLRKKEGRVRGEERETKEKRTPFIGVSLENSCDTGK
jgi:hypothetical protein